MSRPQSVTSMYPEAATKQAKKIVANAPFTIKKIEEALKEHFPYGPDELSKVERVFEAEHSLVMGSLDGTNTLTSTMIEKGIGVVRDLTSTGIAHVRSLERCILLKTPPFEDDDNSVHRKVHKFIKEIREEWSKNLESVPLYYSCRADAIDKLNLASTTNVETTTETQAFSSETGNGKNNSSKVVVREKKVDSGDTGHNFFRQKYMLSLDVQFYANLQMAMTDLLYGYITVMATVEKNWDSLVESKAVRGMNALNCYKLDALTPFERETSK